MAAVTVLVSNDLEYDQRVAKVCHWLEANDYSVLLVGRKLPESRPFTRSYPIKRFRIPVYRGALFYALFNVRLFLFLLRVKTDVILANDLDTLPAAFFASRIRRKRLVYDSHEYFTGAEGLTGRPFQKWVWERFEKFIIPRLDQMFTVNESIASIYRKAYGIPVYVIRNVPVLQEITELKSRQDLQLPMDKTILILQGAFIDPDRGGREAVQAMDLLPQCFLVIIGAGRDLPIIDRMIEDLHLQDRALRLPRMPATELRNYTSCADIGLSLDKPVHLNYTFSLPNKLFDYFHAGVPVLASDLPELRRVIDQYKTGYLIDQVSAESIAEGVRAMIRSGEMETWKTNALSAAKELCWQRESEVLYRAFPRITT